MLACGPGSLAALSSLLTLSGEPRRGARHCGRARGRPDALAKRRCVTADRLDLLGVVLAQVAQEMPVLRHALVAHGAAELLGAAVHGHEMGAKVGPPGEATGASGALERPEPVVNCAPVDMQVRLECKHLGRVAIVAGHELPGGLVGVTSCDVPCEGSL